MRNLTSEVRNDQIEWSRTKALELANGDNNQTKIYQKLRLNRSAVKVVSASTAVLMITMLFSSVTFTLESVGPNPAYANTFPRECIDRGRDPNSNFTSLEYFQCRHGKCITNFVPIVCDILDPSTKRFCPNGDLDFGTGCPTSDQSPISINPPLPNWDTLCTTRDFYANIGTTGKPELHNGLDIPIPIGTPVLAPMNVTVVGKVTIIGKEGRTGYQFEGGSVLYVMSTDGVHLFDFGHLQNGSIASPGKAVEAGDQIALSGDTGKAATGPHLHFSYHIREKDPITNTWSPFILQDPYEVVNKLKSCKK
jgi:Peptidase family M23